MEYLQIFIDWCVDVVFPNVVKNFEELFALVMGLFEDVDLDKILPAE